MQAFNLRVCAGCSILALVVLSWLPAQGMVRTGLLSGSQEHFLAYMTSGLLVAASMPRYRFVHVACFYVLLAVVLEFGQNFAPGRDAQAFTAFISMSGAVVGEIIARLVTGVWREKYGFPPLLISTPMSPTSAACPNVSPSLPAPVLKREPPVGPQWLHEGKFDGWRIQLHKVGDHVVMFSRNGVDMTKRFATIRDKVLSLPVDSAIIDAELVACNSDGKPDFDALMNGERENLCA